MNIDNEVLINEFQKEMIKSNKSSEWWKNHLSEQINNLFGNSLERSTKDAILSSAKAFIESGALETTQDFYQAKEINDKKEYFAIAKLNEKNHIFNITTLAEKQTLINNNEYIKLDDLHQILTAPEIDEKNKKEIANLLDEQKIIELKNNYQDLDETLQELLGENYQQIFKQQQNQSVTPDSIDQQSQSISPDSINQQSQSIPPDNIDQQNITPNQSQGTTKQDNILIQYRNAQNKIDFFNSITNMNEKQNLFNQLSKKEKQEILNSKSTELLNYFYKNAKNKEELLSLMNPETIKSIYYLSSDQDRKEISNYLHLNEHNLNNAINQGITNISVENKNIINYNQEIIKSKDNIINLKNERKEIKLNIKNSKVIIKSLNKRKNKLMKKLNNTRFKKESRIAFINKKRLKKMNNLINELDLVNDAIEENKAEFITLKEKLNKTNKEIEIEKESIEENKQNISKSHQNIIETTQQINKTRIKIKKISTFHKKLIGKKAYNHSKDNLIMTIPKRKTAKISNAQQNQNTSINQQNQSVTPQTQNPNINQQNQSVTPQTQNPNINQQNQSVTPQTQNPNINQQNQSVAPQTQNPNINQQNQNVTPQTQNPNINQQNQSVTPQTQNPNINQQSQSVTPQTQNPNINQQAQSVTPQTNPPNINQQAQSVTPQTQDVNTNRSKIIPFPGTQSETSKNQQKLEQEFNEIGMGYILDYTNNQQNFNFPLECIMHLPKREASIIQLYFEGLYYQKIAEVIKQQQLAMSEKSKTLSKGFSNIIIFILSLTIITLIGILTFLILK